MAVFEALRGFGRLVLREGEERGEGDRAYIFSLGFALQVWFDGFVLLVELGQIWYEIFDDVGMG